VQTPIGKRLAETPQRRAAAALVAILVVTGDLAMVWQGERAAIGLRTIPAVVAQIIYLLLAQGDLDSAGQRWRPVQGLRIWIRSTLLIGAAAGALILGLVAVAVALHIRVPLYKLPPRELGAHILTMCVFVPVIEEAIYRLVLCTGIVPLVGPRWTIIISGAAFGLLHLFSGNPSPDNLIAGFFLAWAYLKSGTILVPIALHSIGNLFVLATWTLLWSLQV
jgi:membrane protease YdiL (CAAX protease family)